MKTGNEPSDRKSNKSDIFVESLYPGTQVIAELYAHDTEIKISLGCMITPSYNLYHITRNKIDQRIFKLGITLFKLGSRF